MPKRDDEEVDPEKLLSRDESVDSGDAVFVPEPLSKETLKKMLAHRNLKK